MKSFTFSFKTPAPIGYFYDKDAFNDIIGTTTKVTFNGGSIDGRIVDVKVDDDGRGFVTTLEI